MNNNSSDDKQLRDKEREALEKKADQYQQHKKEQEQLEQKLIKVF